MENKTCCATGHRDIPDDQIEQVKQALAQEIEKAVQDGYQTFLSGFAKGADLLFAQCVIEARQQHPDLFLEAAIPYPGRLKRLTAKEKALLESCNKVSVICSAYSRNCYLLRNRYMVHRSSLVIAVYDGRETGGTAQTLRFAHSRAKEVRTIQI